MPNRPSHVSFLTWFLRIVLTVVGILAGLAIAQPLKSKELGDQLLEIQAADLEGFYWLILDSARPPAEILPVLQEALAEAQQAGLIETFDPQPQRSDKRAVLGLRVQARPAALERLRPLPGVLAVTTKLPPPPPAVDKISAQEATATISGQVTDAATGLPLKNEFSAVSVYDGVSFHFLGSDSTDALGAYSLQVTAPYTQAKVRANIAEYLPEWYQNKAFFSEADSIPLSGGAVPNKDLALVRAAAISGQVNLDGGGPAVFISVRAYDSDGRRLGSDGTDANGQFTINGLAAGNYTLQFVGPSIVSEWYQDKNSQAEADVFNVTLGSTFNIVTTVTPAGGISGVLTNGVTSGPASGVDVFILDPAGNVVDDTTTDGAGRYGVDGLAAGSYKALFAAAPDFPGGAAYEKQYYNGQTSLNSAAAITVVNGAITPNINATLNPTGSGTISGMFKKNGAPLPFLENGKIVIHDAEIEDIVFEQPFSGDGVTNAYAIPGIKAGRYKVEFVVLGDNGGQVYFDDKSSFATADTVTGSVGGTITNVNGDVMVAALPDTGSITGRLTSQGLPVQGSVQIQAYKSGEAVSKASAVFLSPTDNGLYLIDNLQPGPYLISFTKFPSATTWYDGQISRGQAQEITVAANGTTANIDGVVEDLGACISGKLLNSAGQGVQTDFELYDAGDNQIYFWNGRFGTSYVLSGFNDEDGGYVACGLAAGFYSVKTNGAFFGASAPIQVATGQTLSGVNIIVSSRIYLPAIWTDWSSDENTLLR